MRKYLLPGLCLSFALPAIAVAISSRPVGESIFAHAQSDDLMQGCGDVPEAVALAEELRDRALRIETYMAVLDTRKSEIAQAEAALQVKLSQLQSVKNDLRMHRSGKSTEVQSDIDQLVAVFDQMKPAEAANVMTNLPADFAAEILIRVRTEASARIMASVEPRQAALLTTHMGARSLKKE